MVIVDLSSSSSAAAAAYRRSHCRSDITDSVVSDRVGIVVHHVVGVDEGARVAASAADVLMLLHHLVLFVLKI